MCGLLFVVPVSARTSRSRGRLNVPSPSFSSSFELGAKVIYSLSVCILPRRVRVSSASRGTLMLRREPRESIRDCGTTATAASGFDAHEHKRTAAHRRFSLEHRCHRHHLPKHRSPTVSTYTRAGLHPRRAAASAEGLSPRDIIASHAWPETRQRSSQVPRRDDIIPRCRESLKVVPLPHYRDISDGPAASLPCLIYREAR